MAAPTPYDPAILTELERDEGLRLKPYRCTEGRLTIGYGHNLDAKGISARAALLILQDDVEDAISGLDAALPWWRELSPVRQRVLVNMAFNLGLDGLLGFHDTLAAMKTGDYVGAANHMLNSKWSRQVGERAQRLAKMMVNGQGVAA